MKPSTKDQIAGSLDQMKGALRDKIGRATNNPTLSAKGQVQNLRGKMQQKAGQIRRVFEK
jgi:uncharacterized protein YjbJ (UPF0337 family)